MIDKILDVIEKAILALERLLNKIEAKIYMYRLKRRWEILKQLHPILAGEIERIMKQSVQEVFGNDE